ncbi:MAG: hypothetical protein HUU18_06505 [Phycisphaerales bacterium]|nr:hypothetical protein [Phycisphaerales bacterium]
MFHAWNIDQGASRIGQVFGRANARASLLERLLAFALLVFLGLLLLAVLIPLALLFILGALLLATLRWMRNLIIRVRRPNGPLDGRRNVRVIVPDEPER